MYEEKDWIALECCPICGKERGIAINQKMSKTLPRHVTSDPHLCDDCLKDAKENDWFIIYEADQEHHKKMPKFISRYIKANYKAINPNVDEDTKRFVDKNRFVLMCSEEFTEIMEKENANNDECKNSQMVN